MILECTSLEIDITLFNEKFLIYFQVLELYSIFRGKILSQPIFIVLINVFMIVGSSDRGGFWA